MGKKQKITITVSQELYDKLEKLADYTGLSKNALCTYYVASTVATYDRMFDSVNETISSKIDETLLKEKNGKAKIDLDKEIDIFND